ncbi:PepSY-associated TM helix domain-containing protein [Sphingomonas sp. DT-204]|uniref:PepSY-associated TM helix domain-containing protein n=1 Tax=Sphingomonas sp. DT-204 TaxID=3396166 RepID=UPI003F1D9F31
MRAAVAIAPKRRPIWWRIHAWLGIKLCIFATFVFATGTLATVAHELDWLVDPAIRASPAAWNRPAWGRMLDSAAGAIPRGQVFSLERGPDRWYAATVVVRAPDGRFKRVLLDPATGEVNRVAGHGSIQRFLRDIHRRLMLPLAIGLPLVSSLGLMLLTSLVTGIVTYKKWWRGFFRRPRRGGLRRMSGDLHRLVGVWSLWFVALMAVTGIWYLAEFLGARAPESRPAPTISSRSAPPPSIGGAALDRFVETARRAYPTLEIGEIQFPLQSGTPLGLMGQADAHLVTRRGNAVWIDTATGHVVKVVRGEALSGHQRIAEMADPLHFGTLGGLPTKIIWFLFGVALTGLSVTGVMIHSNRLAEADDAWQRRDWAWAGGFIPPSPSSC